MIAADDASLSPLAALAAEHGRALGLGLAPGSVVAWADHVRPVLLAALARTRPRDTLVVIAATDTQARALADDLRAYSESPVDYFPAWETLPFERVSPGVETMGERMRVVAEVRSPSARGSRAGARPEDASRVIVAPVRALQQRLAPASLTFEPLVVRRGASLDVETVQRTLVSWGYVREQLAEHRGEFAGRGAILDVFGSTDDAPVRIELWGDEVERITRFSVNDQRSTAELDEVVLFPARELIIDDDIVRRARELSAREPWGAEQWERIAQRSGFDGMENWLAWLVDAGTTLLDVLPQRSAIVVCDPAYVRGRGRDVTNEERAVAEALASTWSFEMSAEIPRLHEDIDTLLSRTAASILLTVASPGLGGLDGGTFDGAREVAASRFGSPAATGEALAQRMRDSLRAGYRTVLAYDSSESAKRVRDELAALGVPARLHEHGALRVTDDAVSVVVRALHDGFALPLARILVATESEITGRRSTRKRRARRRGAATMFEDLKAGDFVVHDVHGVGRFEGMARRKLDGVERDFLHIRYADGDLFVLSDQIDFVRQYVGGDAPPLNKMGGADFARTKQRVRNELRTIAQELVVLYQRRLHTTGHAFAPDTPWQAEMEAAFPYVETPDQMQAIVDVKQDMEATSPMDRLVCGDVGFGKTEVALRAVFKCVQDGKQAAVLVPTTLLASQHMATFSERFKPYPMKVEMLSRFVSATKARRVLAGLASGSVDVVIGTHRLLQDGVRWKNLGLLVVDEEQRFGVQHKEAIKMLRTNVDVLTLSATPIPRTLEMSLVGIRDMSLLATPPADRQPIRTYVTAFDDRAAAEAIRRELLRDGQVFWVHNRVETIAGRAEELRRLVPEARITFAHGQMDEAVLERTVIDFWDGKFDVLVCTTIIESGIDMPAVNTLVVEDAQRLGLGQLHQLRGRVGRAGQQAYAFLFHPRDQVLTDVAFERLKTIGEATDLGSGYKIARRDLELRGAGSLLGEQQSGRIAAVGYDLYCQMVSESVAELRGEPPATLLDLKIDLLVDAYLPHDYVDSEELRLDAYRKLVLVTTDDELGALHDEWLDRFGPLPAPAAALLRVGKLRVACHAAALTRVFVQDSSVRVSPVRLDKDGERRAASIAACTYDRDTQVLRIDVPKNEGAVEFLIRVLPLFLAGSEFADN
jgi:transcription-repair coupling factor (superfamily II helicase)